MKEFEIYKSKDGKAEVEVHFEDETVWLTQKQMGTLFGRDRTAITQHLNNIFKEKELDKKVVCKKFSQTTQHGALKGKTQSKDVIRYNLDVIISVGYRVKSKQGTQFRQWATGRLKDYLVQGYVINKVRLEQLQRVVEIIQKSGKSEKVQLIEAKGLLDILTNYTNSFVLLNQYDGNELQTDNLNENITYEIEYTEARSAINKLRQKLIDKKEAADLFGNEKDNGFKSSLNAIVQSFDGRFLYPSIEEQAAHLLYFIIKNHPFVDAS